MGRKFKIRDTNNQTLAIIMFSYILEVGHFIGVIMKPDISKHEIRFYKSNNDMDEIIKGLIEQIGIEKYNDYIEI
ncbi:MAG: hypothetical protein WC223_01530 [Bacteroidales bacterium]|jgi:hypothetical protein